MRDGWNIEGSGASVEPCRLRLICPKGLLSSSACSGDKREEWGRTARGTQRGNTAVLSAPCHGSATDGERPAGLEPDAQQATRSPAQPRPGSASCRVLCHGAPLPKDNRG